MTKQNKQEGEKKPQSAGKKRESGAAAPRKAAKAAETTKPVEKPVMITRREHDKLRRRAIAFERNNSRFILLIPCDGGKGWYEMGNRSALLYKYEVCNRIGVEVEIKDDYDTFFNQFDEGRIRTQYLDTVRDNIKQAQMYKDETKRDNCLIFKLGKSYSDQEIAAIVEEEKRHQAQLNEIVKVKVIDPVVMVKLTELSGRLHRLCLRKMDKVSRDTNGVRIVGTCDEAIKIYYQMASAPSTEKEAVLAWWGKLREKVFDLRVELQLIVDLKIWKRDKVVAMGEMLAELEERIDTHIRKAQCHR